MATNQKAFGLTNGMLTKLPISPRAESTVEIQNTKFVGGVNFIISPFLAVEVQLKTTAAAIIDASILFI